MIRIFIHIKNDVLQARPALSSESFDKSFTWKEAEFQFTDSSLMMINWPILLPELEPEAARSLLDLVGSRFPFSANFERVKELCPEICFTHPNDEWVFFGGSFNPWHQGHQACLNLLPPDKLCFILPDHNPQKDLKVFEPVSNIIGLITKIKFGKNHFCAPSFLLSFQKNPTIDWITKLKKQNPERKLSLLIGFDSFKTFSTWKSYETLAQNLYTLYVVSRLEDESEQLEVKNNLLKVAPKLNIEFLGHHFFENLSSTEIRKTNG